MFFSDQQLRLFKRLLFLLIPYSCLRIGFYFYHLPIYRQFPQEDIFESFLLGLRFDIAAICLLNLPVILLSLVPSTNPRFIKFDRLLFVFLNFAGIVAALCDYELFLFMGKRLSFDFFVIGGDIMEQLPQVMRYYWYFPFIGILTAAGFYFFDRTFFTVRSKSFRPLSHIVCSVLILGFSFVAIRGGLQSKSINVQAAFTQGKNELGHLVLNTPYHFLRTLKNKSLQRAAFFDRDEDAINLILNRRDLRFNSSGKKKNIVLIILESFSNEYMEKGFTPNLLKLSEEGVFFPYHLANGRRSIEALPSLLCGLPSLLDEPISKSIFQGNKFVCMPELLKQQGYTNYFFHGGSRGTMGFESYTLSHGFDRYFSREDYPDDKAFDGTWGIFDGPFFDFFADHLSKMPEPFMGAIFTLSSHHPYAVPEEFHNRFPKGSLEIHESIGYTDYALGKFFQKIQNEEWAKNTIFIITSDHTQKLESSKFQNTIGHYRVPLLVRGPKEDLARLKNNKVTQHSDIPKTILELVGVSGEKLPLTSVSLMAEEQGYALNFAHGHDYYLISKEEVWRLPKGGELLQMRYDWENGQISEPIPSEDLLLKAYLQYFFNGLLNNNLSLYR